MKVGPLLVLLVLVVLIWTPTSESRSKSSKKKNPLKELKNLLSPVNKLVTLLAKALNIVPETLSKVTSTVLSDVELAAQILALDKVVTGGTLAPGLLDLGVLRTVLEDGLLRLHLGGGPASGNVCGACQVGVGYIMFKIRVLKASVSDVVSSAEFICKFFKIGAPQVCRGIAKRQVPSLHFVVTETSELRADSFCGVVLQSFGCATSSSSNDDWLDWDLNLPPRGPPEGPPPPSGEMEQLGDDVDEDELEDDGNNKEEDASSSYWTTEVPVTVTITAPTAPSPLKIVHLTDIHIDPYYDPGAPAACSNKVLCCSWAREKDLTSWHGAVRRGKEAGYWGEGRGHPCDLPEHTLEMALTHIVRQHPDMAVLYITGDLVPHDVWATTKRWNRRIINAVADTIRRIVPANVTVIPALGNHEPHPVNFFSPHGVPKQLDTTWIYKVARDAFGSWIPVSEQHQFSTHGSYAIEISPTLRVLVLNTGVAYELNFWQLYQPRDPAGQLRWLVDELLDAETRGQRVHILGHMPPGDPECFYVWSRNFYRIVKRFHRTITGQFYGHTHTDDFRIIYKRRRPMSVLWVAPSLTAYGQNTSLAYRTYAVSRDDGSVYDHETWGFDLRGANHDMQSGNDETDPDSYWQLAYRLTDEYALPDASPRAMHSLLGRLARNRDLFNAFQDHYYKALGEDEDSDRVPKCAKGCRKKRLCNAVQYFAPKGTAGGRDGVKECELLSKMVDNSH